jgi:hypothetical protein
MPAELPPEKHPPAWVEIPIWAAARVYVSARLELALAALCLANVVMPKRVTRRSQWVRLRVRLAAGVALIGLVSSGRAVSAVYTPRPVSETGGVMADLSKPSTTERLASDFATLANNLGYAFGGTLKPTADRVMNLQSRYALALVEVAHFFERSRVGDDIARKFVELADAIGGLRKGTVAEVLRPASAGGRGPDGHVIWGLRADVCIALECFVRAGEGRDKAAGEIARLYPALDRLKRNANAKLKASILSWRKHINNADIPAGDQRLACERAFFQARAALSPREMRAVGKELLQKVARITETAAI